MATRTKTATIDGDAVARRAYDRYASRGFTDGHDQGDWFAAEAELQARDRLRQGAEAGGQTCAEAGGHQDDAHEDFEDSSGDRLPSVAYCWSRERSFCS